MAATRKLSFADELESLSKALEQAGNSLSSLKCMHEVEMHSAKREVAVKVEQLMMPEPAMSQAQETMAPESPREPVRNPPCLLEDKGVSSIGSSENDLEKHMPNVESNVAHKSQQLTMDRPAVALPHEIATTERLREPGLGDPSCLLGCKEYSKGSEQDELTQYLPSIEAKVAHDAEVLCVLPFADLGYTSATARTAAEALILLKSSIGSKDTAASEFAPSPKPVTAQQQGKHSSTPFAGHIREIWKDAKQESVDRVSGRCSVRIHHHDDDDSDYGTEVRKTSQRQALTAMAQNAGAEIASRAALVGQGMYDMAFCIINPAGSSRFFWNGICLLLITYDLFVVPMQAFKIERVHALQMIEWVLTTWWTLDVYMSFRTGYIVGTRVEMRPKRIAVHYACTWLLCDAIIVVVEWMNRFASAFNSASVMRSQRILRFFRIVKLLRIGKLSSFWKTLQDQVNSNVTILLAKMSMLTGILILTIHITSCIWYALGESSDDGWTTNDEYQGVKGDVFWYFAAIRWVIAQFNGSADLDERRNLTERLYTCLFGIVFAVIARAAFVSLITKSLFDLSDVVSEKTRRRRLVNEYLEANPLSPVLTSQVKRCTNEYHDVDKEMQKEDQVLAILPKHLRTVVLEETVSASQYEKVFDKGDICERMLFTDKLTALYGDPPESGMSPTFSIAEWSSRFGVSMSVGRKQFGSAQTSLDLLDFDKSLKMVKAGSWVSEAALWVEWRNQGRLVSNEHGILLAVSASKLAKGLNRQHPDAYSLAYLHGKNVALELGKQDPSELSDILPFEIQLYSPLCVMVTIQSASGLRNTDGMFTGVSDPYCNCKVVGLTGKGGETRFKTAVTYNTLNPVWNHSAEVFLLRHQLLVFSIYDYDFGKKDQELGLAYLRPEDFAASGFDGDLPLRTSDGVPAPGSVRVKIRILDKEPDAPGLLHLWPQAKKKKKKEKRFSRGFSDLSIAVGEK